MPYFSKTRTIPVDLGRHVIDMKRQPKTVSKRPRRLERPERARIAILLPPRLFAGYVFLTQEMLLVAGTMQARSVDVMGSRLFEIDLLSADGQPAISFADMAVPASGALRTAGLHDVVIVPGQFAPQAMLEGEESQFADWLRAQYDAGALVVGLNAAPLFAKAGLLDGRRATGLASERAWFARHFPDVHYTPDKPLVVDGRLITVSGINPAVDACAYVIDHCRGAGASRRLLRTALTQSLPSYEHMAVWTAQFKRHGDAAVLAIQEIVERELAAPPALAELAAQAAMSERTLTRRFAAATGSNLRRYVAALRLELAAFLLRTGRQSLDHIADECGFGSVSALSRAFATGYGSSPLRYRAQQRGSNN